MARIELGVLCPLEGCFRVNCVLNGEGWLVSMDYAKSKKQEGVAVYLALAGNTLKKKIIVEFEHLDDVLKKPARQCDVCKTTTTKS